MEVIGFNVLGSGDEGVIKSNNNKRLVIRYSRIKVWMSLPTTPLSPSLNPSQSLPPTRCSTSVHPSLIAHAPHRRLPLPHPSRHPSAPPSFRYSLFFSLHGLSLSLLRHHYRCRHLWCLSMNRQQDPEGNHRWRLRRARCRMHRWRRRPIISGICIRKPFAWRDVDFREDSNREDDNARGGEF
ncbi:hypothetical protein HN51_045794 [Arachis hypogaea]|uniref:uncharacterized protein LOC107613360 isoform X1 n=1 Tax=Arachis ipaensis TaxID=130454 RepID=UPI0007AEF83D|nr:uncharacterized protein LOC107613360 isoform X1 [Arachis ipaensis]XP_025671779.1 uncharacterized protein LOC112771300 isoform X1 [Arachis hypogaea]